MSALHPSRRDALKAFSLAGLGLSLSPSALDSVSRPEGFSFVHLTDSHVRRKRRGHEGYAACVASVNALTPRPELVLMGGDMAFDGLYTERDEFEDQITLFRDISNQLAMPWHPCIGNHDILGWSSRRKVPVDDPELGKAMIMNRLGMERSYYSFNHGGWHFVVLDTFEPVQTETGPSYVPKLGAEQLDWLRFDLGAHPDMPTVCVMHIAAFCHSGQIQGNTEMRAMGPLNIQDTVPFREICERHGVKAVLQGHTHQIEDFRYNGVWYLTSPSVSAAWWGGNWRGFEPGYTVFHAHPDGTLTWERKTFAWEHHLEPEDELERRRIGERAEFVAEQRRLYEEEMHGRP